MKNSNFSFRKRISPICLFVLMQILVSGDEIKWMAIGSLHDWYSSGGSEIEVGRRHLIPDQQDGLRFPAQYKWQDSKASKALWIGTTNYYDPTNGITYDHKVSHVGPRVLDEENEFIPQEFKLIGKYEHPGVYVNGQSSSELDYMDLLDEVDPDLPSDRMLHNVVNTSTGITMIRKIYGFAQQNHDNYFIYDYVFKNTGIVDSLGTVYPQTLTDVIFFFQYRYAIAKEACSYGYSWLHQNATWGRNTMNEVIGENPTDSDPFRASYSWQGLHSWWPASGDNIGAPYYNGDGRLGASQFVGTVTIHADQSPTIPVDDPFQPMTTQFIDSDGPYNSGNSHYNAEKMTLEYSKMSVGHPPMSHAEEVGDGYADQYGATGGGYSQAQGFGPYTLAPGDSIHIVLAEGVAGLSRELCYSIGEDWLNGIISNDLKNALVFTGVDSLMQTFQRAIDTYNSNFSIPQPPPPPAIFEIVSSDDRIILYWDNNAESTPNFSGYKIFRSMHQPDTFYTEIYDGPAGINQFDDMTVEQGIDYYYYIVSYDDGSTNEIHPGSPLQSSLFMTRTNQPAYLNNEPAINADLYVNPNGNDSNSGLSPDSALQTITYALSRIVSSNLFPNTIYLNEGVYSPSTNGETFPLNWKSHISLSGSAVGPSILDAENQSNILACVDIENCVVENITIINGYSEIGGGIHCINSELELKGVSLRNNTALIFGGGIASNSSIINFDENNLCNIYSNSAPIGSDLSDYGEPVGIMDVHVDTFTVLSPSDYHAYPSFSFVISIQNHIIEQINADLYVNPNGENSNSGLSPNDPWKTITHAIIHSIVDSLNPHTIYLAEGVYAHSTTGEQFPLFGRSYLSFSGSDQLTTILDAEDSSGVFRFSWDNNVLLEKLTIRNGSRRGLSCVNSDLNLVEMAIRNNTTSYSGGGIRCFGNSQLNISNSIIAENSAGNDGAGIACYGLEHFPVINLSNTHIIENTAGRNGGGISIIGSASQINFDTQQRCNIYNNEAGDYGNDLYGNNGVLTELVLDTFTVLYPTEEYAYPLDNFTFDIWNYKIEQAEADLFVNPNGSDDNSGLSDAEPLRTITHALSLIFADESRPHTIYLSEGIYSPSSNGEIYPLIFKSYVSISGVDQETTILDAEGFSRVITCENINNLAIENLTIMNGFADDGGGIFCYYSNPNIIDVNAINNTASNYGGGMYFEFSSSILTNIVVTGNTATQIGGGIYSVDNSDMIINNCIISNNISNAHGGGLNSLRSNPIIMNTTISGDSSRKGGGLSFIFSNPILSNVTINGNTASSQGGGIYARDSYPVVTNATITNNSAVSRGGGLYLSRSSSIIINSILWNDIPQEIRLSQSDANVFYSDIQGSWEGVGNIAGDPLFVDPENGDFNLLIGSPCIDSGIDFFVWESDTLVDLSLDEYDGNAPDMGVYESPYTVAIANEQILPDKYALHQNYPNPFNPVTTIEYDLPENATVLITIYDILGREVIILANKRMKAGYHSVQWKGINNIGTTVSAGMYFYRISVHDPDGIGAGDFNSVKKMILLK